MTGTIGAGTVLAPYGGLYRDTPVEAMAALLPVDGETTTATLMAHGYDPYLSSWSPFHGAALAVTESLAKIAAAGGDARTCRLTFQEYFERLNKDSEKWGAPVAAMLGGLWAQLAYGTASIGGKDSMSGTFEDIHVPPTLVSFAVNVLNAGDVISGELKSAGHKLALLRCPMTAALLPDAQALLSLYDELHALVQAGKVVAAHTVGRGGVGGSRHDDGAGQPHRRAAARGFDGGGPVPAPGLAASSWRWPRARSVPARFEGAGRDG